MDFVRNRLFRQTLLVHQGAPIRRNLDGRVVKGLLLDLRGPARIREARAGAGRERDVQGPQRHGSTTSPMR